MASKNKRNSSNIYQENLVEDDIDELLYLKTRHGYGGYNPNYFFNEPSSSKRIPVCSSCSGIVRESQRVVECDHIFCKKCLDNLASCPEDGLVFLDIKIEKMKQTDKHILQRKIHCPLAGRNCDWRGKLSELDGHIKRCLFIQIKCQNGCPIVYARTEHESHESSCTAKQQECRYCGKIMVGRELIVHESRECPETPMECPYHCANGVITRKEYEQHINENCPAMIIQCPFLKYGCYTALTKVEMNLHVEKDQARHLGYVCDKVTQLENENELAVRKIDELSSESEAQKSFNEQMQYELDSLNEKMLILSLNSTTILQDAASSIGVLTWHVPAIKTRWSKNELKLTSKPLYSGPKGYKFVMEIDCCERDNTNYLSVYVRPMRGVFDLMLIWPFTGEFVFYVLNQFDDSNHFSKSLILNEKLHFDRVEQDPSADRLGIEDFISDSEIYSYSRYGGVYLRIEIIPKFVIPLWLI
ncbi:TNF receptor-associated factor 4-like [Oopsacas minuta]|uniref:TNF receptor-associated factor 4-like n=1 Tax=Oopsacas minuta TaxID=111878 RepID=A0AAV7JKL4_9METZ|nr:TNF receptor-associated factor 4-like [Oopsacas minuta]